MKIATVVGARPQFIKAAVVSNVINKTKDILIISTICYNLEKKTINTSKIEIL